MATWMARAIARCRIVLAPGEFYMCSFSQGITGAPGDVFPDTVTASGVDSLQRPVSASASAEVEHHGCAFGHHHAQAGPAAVHR